MKRLQDPRCFLILMFIGVIVSVPLVQALMEVREGDGVRAFQLFEQSPNAANLRNFERSLESANWLAHLTRPWLQLIQFQWLKDGAEKVTIGKQGWYFYKPGLKYMSARHDPTQTAQRTNDPVAAIVDFRNQLAAAGIHLVVMPVPNKESIYPDHLSSRAESMHGVLSPRTENILSALRAANVEVIDLFHLFAEARKKGDSLDQDALYLKQDTHWSPRGVDLAAKDVARHLKELNWAQLGRAEYLERPAPVKRHGDILRMLQVPQIEQRTDPELVETVQVIDSANSQPYTDKAEAEILVMGDSFLRIYQQDAPGSAGFIAHLAKELKQPMMSLVNDGGGSTLVRQELRARPIFLKNKKVVIWEFVERDIGLGVEGWKLVTLGQ